MLDSRPKGRGFEPHRHHCVVSLSKNINPSLIPVQPKKTRPFINERLLMGREESNQTNKQNKLQNLTYVCSYSEVLMNAKSLQYIVDAVATNITGQFLSRSSLLSLDIKCIIYSINSELQLKVPYICSNINSKEILCLFS